MKPSVYIMSADGPVAAIPSTDALWQSAHNALCDGRWSAARAFLDDLGRRGDVVDLLLSIDQYVTLSGKELRSDYRTVLADRIEMVNWRVNHRSEGY